ncbi:predicted protein [Nematostella vectensis]|uniref:G-protein coupled receptors family 1 profile domain-containing protein n=1 Tax=Nematostella vectensis TaxID=45351 RepID=A7S3T7_NEMVE|nr:predicted protein [Nematostella vectensis]|eukprot:XP_001633609.1 predicted protein [Nematostella vectensis]
MAPSWVRACALAVVLLQSRFIINVSTSVVACDVVVDSLILNLAISDITILVFLPLMYIIPQVRVIALLWIFGVLMNLPFFVIARFDAKLSFCSEAWPNSLAFKCFTLIWLGIVAIVPGICMAVLYSKILHTLWIRKAEQLVSDSETDLSGAQKEATKVVITVSFIHCICWIPPSAHYIKMVFAPEVRVLWDTLHLVAVLMIAFVAFVKPLVYIFQSKNLLRSKNTVNPYDEGRREETKWMHTWIPPGYKEEDAASPTPKQRVRASDNGGFMDNENANKARTRHDGINGEKPPEKIENLQQWGPGKKPQLPPIKTKGVQSQPQ